MDLRYSEEQKLIGQQAREFFERECPLETVRTCWGRQAALPAGLWRRMGELGWLGATIPEALGGTGLSHTDLSRILEEAGRGLLPGGLLPHLAASRAVLLAGSAEQHQALLPAAARGELRLTLARSREGGRFDRLGGRFYADGKDDGFLLFGEKLAVPALAGAGRIVVEAVLGLPREIAAGLQYFVVEPDAPGVEITPLDTLEGGLKQASLRLTGTPVGRAFHLAGGDGGAAMAQTAALIDLALAFDALGGAQRVLDMTVEYARLRTAFGQPIGTFQAVKHKCADMLYAVENLRSIAIWAAWVLDVPQAESGGDALLATAMARATAIESYDQVIRHATQVHGAIGTTEEHDLHLFARRGKTLALSFGSLAHYQERILSAHGLGLAPTRGSARA